MSAQGRGWSIPVSLSYNSQNWVQDASGNDWQFGTDTGYGYGWNLRVGALRKYSLSNWNADYYEFRDSSGAVYRLNQNNNGVWSSSESVYVWFDSNANILHFANGSTWYFGCMSSLGEQDAGDLYPTNYTGETMVFLTGVTNNATGLSTSLAYDPSGSGELNRVTFPYGGYFRWAYGNETYAANRTVPEVASRYLLWDSTIGERTITFSRDSGDSARNLPLYRQAADSHANAVKTWYPNASGAPLGLIATYNESSASPSTLLRQTAYTWTQDSTGNNYLATTRQTTDPGSSTPATKRVIRFSTPMATSRNPACTTIRI